MPQQSRSHSPEGRREAFRAPTAIVFLPTALLIWLLMGRTEDGAARQTLDCLSPSLEAFFTSHLFHQNGLHLTLTVLTVLIAGGQLETRWGTPRFLGFYALVVLGSTGVQVVAAHLCVAFGFFDPETRPVAIGGSALALACLAASIRYVPDRSWLGFFPARRTLWAFLFLGAAGLVWLDTLSARAAAPQQLFLLPQLSGVVFAMIWVFLDPICEHKLTQWKEAQEEREKERVGQIRDRVEDLLEKISSEGFDSLSADEKSFLRHASKHFKRE